VLAAKIATPCQGRIYYIRYALKLGWTVERIHELSHIDVWFLDQLAELVEFEERLVRAPVHDLATQTFSPELVRRTAEKAADYSTGIHAHLCEHRAEVRFCLER